MYSFDTEQQAIVEAVDELSPELADHAFTREEEFPCENLTLLSEHGLLGLNIAEEYGGGGLTEHEAVLAVEAVGEVCPDTAELLMNCSLVAPRAIEMFGSETAKDRYLPPVMDGEEFISIAMSEPDAGSDLRSMSTAVQPEDGRLVMNGEKIWVGRLKEASAAVVWTKFPEGLGTVVLDLDAPGVDVVRHYTNMAGTTQTHFSVDGVEIPPENVLARGEEAFSKQIKSLNWERVGAAAFLNGVATNALRKAVAFAEEREQFGQQIGEFQGIQWKIADSLTRLESSRALTARAAENALTGVHRYPDPLVANMAKLEAADVANEVVDKSLQIHGARGYMQEHPLEYLYRLVRGYRIAGGTDEIQRNTIASLVQDRGLPSLLSARDN